MRCGEEDKEVAFCYFCSCGRESTNEKCVASTRLSTAAAFDLRPRFFPLTEPRTSSSCSPSCSLHHHTHQSLLQTIHHGYSHSQDCLSSTVSSTRNCSFDSCFNFLCLVSIRLSSSYSSIFLQETIPSCDGYFGRRCQSGSSTSCIWSRWSKC